MELTEIKTRYDVCKLNLTYYLKSLILLSQKKASSDHMAEKERGKEGQECGVL